MKFDANTTPKGRAAQIGLAIKNDPVGFERNAYKSGNNLSAYLETLDPSSDHSDGTDAFQRVLRSAGIVPRSIPELGIRASRLGEVGENPVGKYLIGEIISRAWRKAVFSNAKERRLVTSNEPSLGSVMNPIARTAPRNLNLEAAIAVADLVAITTGIDATVYEPFFLEDVEQVNSRVAQGAEIPAVKISTSDKTIKLRKFGRRIDVTYESLRHIPIDMLAYIIQRIAIKVEASKVDTIVGILQNGDGNAGTAATVYNKTDLQGGLAADPFNLRGFVAFLMKFQNPYALTTLLGMPADALDIFLMDSGTTNFPLAAVGNFLGNLGVRPLNRSLDGQIDLGWLDSVATDTLHGFDNRTTVERVFEIGGNVQETGRWIENQIQFVTMTETEGFAILEPEGNKLIDLSS